MLFSWLVEAFIAWTSPGLLFMSAVFIFAPWLKPFLSSPFEFGKLNILVYGILWPTVIGIGLNSVGLLIFNFLATKMNFVKRVEQSLTEQLAQAEMAAMDHSFSWLNHEQLKLFNNMSSEDKSKFFASYTASQKDMIVTDITKRLNTGLSLAPHISFLSPDIKKEIRYTTSAPSSLHVFSLGILGMAVCALIYNIAFSLINKSYINLLYQSLPLVVALCFLIKMVFQFAAAYYSSLYNVFVGIGGILRKNQSK